MAYKGDENWDSLVINKTGDRMIEVLCFWYSRPSKYEFIIPKLDESFKYLIPACEELKSNKHFHEYLGTILGLGNIMNGGTSKGLADGFSSDLLPKLSTYKIEYLSVLQCNYKYNLLNHKIGHSNKKN